VHSTQFSSPGATAESTEPVCVKPLELRELMLSLRKPVTAGNWKPP
jgi:hypothetical protein